MKGENINHLSAYLEKLQSQGKYTFLKSIAISDLNISPGSYKGAANRLIKKRRLAFIRPNFYVIVPFEYCSLECLPASWFIDDLMKYLNIPYYVGLLTAAAIYGAGHQQPNVFQVITKKCVRPINRGEVRIDFVYLKFLEQMPTIRMKTATGYMSVATPETTACDLIRYMSLSAQINNVATVLAELSEKLDAEKLLAIAQKTPIEVSIIQRLGYLLDYVNAQVKTDVLAKFVLENSNRYVPLVIGKTGENIDKKIEYDKNRRWKIIVNENVEPDL
jgi:predicted transcriptional regulator of viral defense system